MMFRNGIIEGVFTVPIIVNDGDERFFQSSIFEKHTYEAFEAYLRVAEQIDIEPPFFLFSSIHGVKCCRLSFDVRRFTDKKVACDRDDILLPEVVVKTLEESRQ
jgi:hypothetical protein